MKIYSRKKQATQPQFLSLPTINRRRSTELQVQPLVNTKLKADGLKYHHKIPPHGLASPEAKKTVINLEEINRKVSMENLLRQEHEIERKKITLNQETIDLWKLKHCKSVVLGKKESSSSMILEKSKSFKLEMGANESNQANKNQKIKNGLYARMESMESFPQIQQFLIQRVKYERGKEQFKKQKKVVSKEKIKRKSPVPHHLFEQGQEKVVDTEKKEGKMQVPPSQWETSKNRYTEEDESFAKETPDTPMFRQLRESICKSEQEDALS